MRIIAGIAKGRKLLTPKGLEVRPTTDRVKEAIFSMISLHIPGSIVLDLFSGTGNLGLEALSRGAEKAYFIDNNRNSMKLTVTNIANIGLQKKSETKIADAIKAIEDFSYAGTKFDIVFMDPPYGKGMIIPCMKAIDNGKILNKDGIIVIEHNQTETIDPYIEKLELLKEKKYGNTIISIYTMEKEA